MVSSRTELPTSESPLSTDSVDLKLLRPFERCNQLTISDGPDPHVEGAKGGNTGGEQYKPSEHGGVKKDGTEDKRTSSEHGFGGS
jgi:hypothetical protein